MNRWMLLLAVVVLPAWAGAVDIRGKGSDAVDTAAEKVRGDEHESHDWASDRVEALREDFDRFERRIEDAEPKRQEKARERLSELKERVSKLEGRMETRDHKVYDEVEDELDDIRGEFREIRRDLNRR